MLLGIISTYVENTQIIKSYKQIVEDHLHIRGEYADELLPQLYNQGSSPHTWRIQNFISDAQMMHRIISTYVENTINVKLLIKMPTGSSPHTWRIHYFSDGSQFAYRIISTYVENTHVYK